MILLINLKKKKWNNFQRGTTGSLFYVWTLVCNLNFGRTDTSRALYKPFDKRSMCSHLKNWTHSSEPIWSVTHVMPRITLYCYSECKLVVPVFCLGFFCRARRPAPFSWRPALLKKPKWRPALFISHTWLLALFCPFCCPHTAWIVLCIFYWAIQGHF